MKNNIKKSLILCLLAAPMAFGVVGCNSSDKPDPIPDPVEVVKYHVTLPSGEGYVINGEEEATEGKDYYFTLSIKDEYESSELVVKCNSTPINGSNGLYVVHNVQTDLNITVEGVYKKSFIKLTKSLFRFPYGQVEVEQRQETYYTNNATGSYRGNPCDVVANISNVNFDQLGIYDIEYHLLGHEEVRKYAAVEIYEPPVVNDITVDLGDIYTPAISATGFEAHVDFEIKDSNGHVLSEDEVKYDATRNVNHFTLEYLKNIELGTYTYTVTFGDGYERTYSVQFKDELAPNVLYSKEPGVYGALATDSVVTPSAALTGDSAQKISFKYFLNEEEIEEPVMLDEVGDYTYEIKTYRNSEEVVALNKKYTYHIVDNYDLEDKDLNDKFYFYAPEAFGKYFGEATVNRTDAGEGSAFITGKTFTIKNELLREAKARGYVSMRINLKGESLDGEPFSSIPFTSQGLKDSKGEAWKKYWGPNPCSAGWVSTVIDLNVFDFDAEPNWYLQFAFRTSASGGNNADGFCTVKGLEFSKTTLEPVEPELDKFVVGTGKVVEKEISEEKYNLKVTGLTTKWKNLTYTKANKLYEEGYRKVTITVTGNTHNMFAFVNTIDKIDGYGYGSKIPAGGGTVTVLLKENNSFVGVMTSQEYPQGTGIVQDTTGELGGLEENFDATFEFIKIKEPSLDTMFESPDFASLYMDRVTSITSTDDARKSLTFTGNISVGFSEKFFNELRTKGAISVVMDFTFTNSDVKGLAGVSTLLSTDAIGPYNTVFGMKDGKIRVTLDQERINTYKSFYFFTRNSNTNIYSASDVVFGSGTISNFKIYTSADAEPSVENDMYSSKAWISTDSNIKYDVFEGTITASKSWSMYFKNMSYVDELLEAGYKTMSFKVKIEPIYYFSYMLNTTNDREAIFVQEKAADGVYSLTIDLTTFTYLQLRGEKQASFNPSAGEDWSTYCAGVDTVLYDFVLTK